MDPLATIARHRRVIVTVADMTVTAAAGGSLRVVVDGGHPDDATFADQLTQALHARGRCRRCLLPRPDTNPTGDPTARPRGAGSAPAVIIEGRSGLDDSDPLRIHIRVLGPAEQSGSQLTTGMTGPGRRDGGQLDERRPDLVVDYLDPAGPTIRIVPPQAAATR
ncbi:hypothetical protein [Dactylosporangium sp. NPDC049140]|uniref:hypothetical protein n=1 Tax=Dactylosporangium sp. NPDC049140 TaxID=3155647 RepID=UPI0033EAE053